MVAVIWTDRLGGKHVERVSSRSVPGARKAIQSMGGTVSKVSRNKKVG